MEKENNGLMTTQQMEKLELEIRSLRNSISWLARLVPLITIILAIGSFLFGIYQMKQGFDNNVTLSEKEFRRKFYEDQLATYLEISQTAAEISALDDQNKIREDFQKLLEFRYGKLFIVCEDQQVLDSLDQFLKYRDTSATKDDLSKAAIRLANACRNSLRGFWQIPIPELKLNF